jgi:RNA polymerase sigma-70 factor (family 1)
MQNICEEEVFKNLFLQLSKPLRNFLLYKFRDEERAADMVQDAFVKLWNNCQNVRLETAKAYVYKVANNLYLNQIEKDQVRMKFVQRQGDRSNTETPEFQLEEAEFKTQLEAAINALPAGQREVFLLNRIDKMTYREIAEHLEVSVKAVEKRMHKALVKMRQTIKNI